MSAPRAGEGWSLTPATTPIRPPDEESTAPDGRAGRHDACQETMNLRLALLPLAAVALLDHTQGSWKRGGPRVAGLPALRAAERRVVRRSVDDRKQLRHRRGRSGRPDLARSVAERLGDEDDAGSAGEFLVEDEGLAAVSYTHLTLPTN